MGAATSRLLMQIYGISEPWCLDKYGVRLGATMAGLASAVLCMYCID